MSLYVLGLYLLVLVWVVGFQVGRGTRTLGISRGTAKSSSVHPAPFIEDNISPPPLSELDTEEERYAFKCPICLESFSGSTDNEESDGVFSCPQCYNKFCSDCVESHRKTKQAARLAVSCPLCNYELQAAPATATASRFSSTRRNIGHNFSPRVPLLIGRDALFLSVMRRDVVEIQRQLDGGISVNSREGTGKTPLLMAASMSSAGMIEVLLRHPDVLVDARDNNGDTALMLATHSRDISILRMLLDGGADVNARSRDGKTALFYATTWSNDEAVSFLIERGADISLGPLNSNGDTETPLMFAQRNGFTSIAQILNPSRGMGCSIS